MLRWFLTIYLLFCMALFFFAMIYMNGMQFEGAPMGTYYGTQDVSGMNRKNMLALAEAGLKAYSSLSFEFEHDGRDFSLEYNRHYFLKIDPVKAEEQYRELIQSVPWYQRLMSFLKLDYSLRQFSFDVQIDEGKTVAVLNRLVPEKTETFFRLDSPEQITRWQKGGKVRELVRQMQVLVQTKSRGVHHLNYKESSVRKTFALKDMFKHRILKDALPVSGRGLKALEALIAVRPVILLNDGETFSFLDWVRSANLNLAEFGQRSQIVEKMEYEDFYGLGSAVPALLRVFYRLGFAAREHSRHVHWLKDHFDPGFEAVINAEHDLKYKNTWKEAIVLSLSLKNQTLHIEAFYPKALEQNYEIREISRTVDRATILSTPKLNPELRGLSPLNGVTVTIERKIKEQSRVMSQAVLLKAQYKRRDGYR